MSSPIGIGFTGRFCTPMDESRCFRQDSVLPAVGYAKEGGVHDFSAAHFDLMHVGDIVPNGGARFCEVQLGRRFWVVGLCKPTFVPIRKRS